MAYDGFTPEELEALEAASQETSEDSEKAEEHEFDAALKAIVSSGLVAGPDPSIVEDLVADADGVDSADVHRSGEDSAVDAADDDVSLELEGEVNAIYAQIVARAPEHKVQPSLDRVRDALDLMGNPHRAFHAIHITGTNGKTSTARMIEALLRERGLRTGRFTSPHLTTVRERITVDGRAISRRDFIETYRDVEPFIDMVDAASVASGGPRMSFFEVFTVMAYAAFANAPVDVAVIEVGMGGRWDATNVVDGDVAVLMPIGLDHERWLGSTVEEIAAEKVGIIKPGAVVVSAPQEPVVEDIIAEAAAAAGARLVPSAALGVVARETAVGGQLVSLRTPAAVYGDVPLALRGRHQADNAAVALTAVEQFFDGRALGGDVVEHALMAVTSPGRLETVRSSPTVVVDAAHNPHGATATVEALDEYFPGPRVAVVAMMADKDVEGFLGVLEPAFEAVVVTDMPTERAMDADELADIAVDVFGEDRVETERDLVAAIDRAVTIAEQGNTESLTAPCVVVLGSIQLVAAARTLMGKPAADGA